MTDELRFPMGIEDFAAAAAAAEEPVGVRALEALGKGFDLSSDFRLKFAKGLEGPRGGRLVVLDEINTRDVLIPGSGGGLVVQGVSEDIRCDKGDRIRFKSDVLEFNQVGFFGRFDSISVSMSLVVDFSVLIILFIYSWFGLY